VRFGIVRFPGSCDEVDALRGWYEALSGSGSVTVPFELAPWGVWFGMCMDRFGTSWLVNAGAPAGA